MRQGVARRQSDECAAGKRIEMRRALAAEVRQEDQPFGAGRNRFRQVGEIVVPEMLTGHGTQRVAEPAERSASRECDRHQVVTTGHTVAEGVQPPMRIKRNLVGMGEDNAAGADAAADDAGLHDTCADCCRCIIAAAGNNRQTYC